MSGVEKLCLTSQSILHPLTVDFSWSRSDFIPNSALDRSQLRVLIAETRRNIEKCDLKDTRRVQLAKILEFQESLLLSPIHRLPPEIMSVILELVTPEGIIIIPGFGRRAGIPSFR
ncbi:hypothetical protein BT96DRAFT_618603 [Gymnopus androsaceus JB14]|uniref:F-box domain-containing protein n=1 Tax=Gymnopus androsaceus JB14 TaxID=1447944 RepID=A0A6A4GHB1_9AGAR|nr:hypothetical protein BT96DRAFT_618603 [Gymnopus androsaceus JB14]